jgi:hypothetical protein
MLEKLDKKVSILASLPITTSLVVTLVALVSMAMANL